MAGATAALSATLATSALGLVLLAGSPAGAAARGASSNPAGRAAARCPAGRVVRSPSQLRAALAKARPGAVIDLAQRTFAGTFTIKRSGTRRAPITLCGPARAVIDGRGGSHVLYLDGADWWHLTGFQITRGGKGLMLEHASHNTVTRLRIHRTAAAAVHVNSFSSDNVFNGLVVSKAGDAGFYIGSAEGNWCLFSGCKPDASDGNVIEHCDVSGTAAEAVDIKEGTSGGKVLDSHFNGVAMTKTDWVNVKGNGYLISGNVGVDSPADGFSVHVILPGWGQDNVFAGNSATVDGPGYGFYIQQPGAAGNTVACGQTVVGAAAGYSNVACG